MKGITGEEPKEHWYFLDIKDKVVLDLGCGRWMSSISTAEWFLNEGAKQVIGVELANMNLNNDRFVMEIQRIGSSEQLEDLFNKYKPDIIKCDIEGAEIYFDNIESIPEEIRQFAVEYHNADTKKVCEQALERWNFKNIETYQFVGYDFNTIGVINAWTR